MRLYIDMCSLRPFDDQSQARVQVATLAIEAILQLCRAGEHTMVASDTLRFENARNPNGQRRQFAADILTLAVEDVSHSAALEMQALVWQNAGVELLDALHLASAEIAGVDRFATCDDVLLRKAARVTSKVQIMALVDLFKELIP